MLCSPWMHDGAVLGQQQQAPHHKPVLQSVSGSSGLADTHHLSRRANCIHKGSTNALLQSDPGQLACILVAALPADLLLPYPPPVAASLDMAC